MRSSILFDNVPLKQLTEVKFVGVYLDESLTWKSHIGYICKKIAKSVGIIYRCRFLLSTKTKTSLLYTLIYPYLTYIPLTNRVRGPYCKLRTEFFPVDLFIICLRLTGARARKLVKVKRKVQLPQRLPCQNSKN